jgi:hypothetical protein
LPNKTCPTTHKEKQVLKYIPIAFIAIVCQTLGNTATTGFRIYLDKGELETANRLLSGIWLFNSASIVMYALIATLLVFDLRKLGK